ncbi:MAG: phosphogluconate dehydrogenase (NAD(+)-dependent, decarboxylating) [Acidimicrobiales bacterium]
MRLGMIGLGKMGANMAERLARRGHDVVGYDAFSEATQVPSLEALVDAIGPAGERIAWVMVPSGEPTEQVVTTLAGLLAPGDLVIDGGNSFYRESLARAERLADKRIGFIDCGTSGGVWGLENGYCLMVGGTDDDVARARPIFDALTPDDGGFAHAGPVGSGHFTKMVHNGVEYGMMQAFAEGYEILSAHELDVDVIATLDAWRQSSVVRSWLLDLLVDGLKANPTMEGIAAVAKDSGEGRWTVEEAVRLGVPAAVIAGSLWTRLASQRESEAMKVISLLRNQFGGHGFETRKADE